ncbi:uncharacterized protein LOC131699578 [Acipenser ruthenus]|uniref:uncharacterized protein LOC131699578 n=1 Tax=Acipenser ruthenus TaxID=7906 RepID=UPI0027410801|nr:uncharacterized protein LOC131699578 [Acipenser ruthenus]
MLYEESQSSFVQGRTKRGGGTRKLEVPKEYKKDDLLKEGIRLFFPNGKNSVGNLDDFEFNMTNYENVALDDITTVGALDTQTKLSTLRFYLTAKRAKKTPGWKDGMQEVCEGVNPVSLNTSVRSETKIPELTPLIDEICSPDCHTTLPCAEMVERSTIRGDSCLEAGQLIAMPSATTTISPEESTSIGACGGYQDPKRSSNIIVIYEATDEDTYFLRSDTESGQALDNHYFEDSTISFFMGNHGETDDPPLDDTLPLSDTIQVNICSSEQKKILCVHRGQLLQELIAHFSEDGILENEISIQLVLPDGKIEKAQDEGGVMRDCLHEFWSDFYEQCTLDTAYKMKGVS